MEPNQGVESAEASKTAARKKSGKKSANAPKSLDAAVDALYKAFGGLPVAKLEDVTCEDCLSDQDREKVHTEPVRTLTADDLSWLGVRPLSIVGDVEDFRYFLPRLLDLSAQGALEWPDPDYVFEDLGGLDWRSWPQNQAIEGFLAALWADTLSRHPAPGDIRWLGSALGPEADMSVYLEQWGRLDTASAIKHLHDLVMWEMKWSGARPYLLKEHWKNSGLAHDQIIDWLAGGPAAQAVQDAFDRTRDEGLLALLADMHPILVPVRVWLEQDN